MRDPRDYTDDGLGLWRLIAAPTVWAVHFVIAYALVSTSCGHLGAETIGTVRAIVGGLTAVAFALILWLGWRSWAQWDILADRDWENDQGTNEDRTQFLGHAGFLLAVISFIGVAYVSLPVVLFGSCA